MTLSGAYSGRTHVFPVRVYFADTDAFGVVYHSRYLEFAEKARTEMLRLDGLVHAQFLAEQGFAFAVRRLQADYRRPAKLDDLLDVHTTILAVSGASVEVRQDIVKDGLELVRLTIQLACVHTSGRPGRLSPTLRSHLQSLVPQEAHPNA